MKKAYRWFADHLTKALGVLGASFMSIVAYIDPAAVREAAQTYLGDKWVAKIGIALFVLVVLRGWYTGWKSKQPNPAVLPPPVNAAKVLMIALVLATTFSTCIAVATEVPVEKDAPKVEGHPLTSVVVTQCNLIVAVYMTMPDGRLLRFDKSAAVPSEQLMTMAYSAVRSERVEVSCNDLGAAGYEKHEPV
jgi:hypothetical protein